MLIYFPQSEPQAAQRPAEQQPQRRKRRGATAMEYLFMLSLIIAVLVAVVQQIGQITKGSLEHSAKEISKKTP